MREWLAELAGEQYVDAILWTSAALVALVVLLALVKIFRNLNSGTFVAGGRNRKTRLAVMDATAIDGQRRLVLIRRDDVEHLLLIGGPTDVVVEQDIRLMAQRRQAPPELGRPPQAESEEPAADLLPQPARPAPPLPPRPAPEPVSQPAARPAPPPPPVERPARPAPPPLPRPSLERPGNEQRTAPPPLRTPPPAPPVLRPAPASQPTPAVRPAPRPAPASARNNPDSIEETLMNELDLSGEDLLGGDTPAPARDKPGTSLDDEMARLLGELANPRR